MNSLILALSLSLTLPTMAKVLKKDQPKRGIASILESEELTPTKADQNTAYLIYDLINTEDYSQVSRKIEALKPVILSNSRFIPFHTWAKNLSAMNHLKGTEVISDYCLNMEKSQERNYDFTIQTYTENLCVKNYFSALEKKILAGGSLTSTDKIFLEKENRTLVRKELKGTLSRFLKRIETKGVPHSEFSRIIAASFIKNEEIPSQDILKNMLITYELTSFIQKGGFNKPQNQKVYGNEFDDLGRKVISSVAKSTGEFNRSVNEFINFYKYNAQYLQTKTAKNRILFVGKELTGDAQYTSSQRVLALITKDADPEVSHEALFVSLWSFLAENKYEKAMDYIEENKLLDVFPNLSLKLKYWVAHTVERNKKKGMSIKLYSQIVEQNPISFYSVMAIKNLNKLKETEGIGADVYNLEKPTHSDIAMSDFSESFRSGLIRLKLWDQYNIKDLARAEITQLNNAEASDIKSASCKLPDTFVKENAYIIMAGAFSSNNNYIGGFNLIQQGLTEKRISHNSYLLTSLFPSLYVEDIKKLDNNIDPIILMSLIRQESGFNPRAKSQVGARGLMQLMPATAKMMNRRVKPNDLEKPGTNLKLGIQHFKYLMKKYDNNLVYVLAAYNAGEHRVNRWQKDVFNKDESMLKTIERIPYQETRDYVKLIFRNMYFYKMLAANRVDNQIAHSKIYDINLGFTH